MSARPSRRRPPYGGDHLNSGKSPSFWQRLFGFQELAPAYITARAPAGRRCPECSERYEARDRYCPRCHEAVPEWRFG